MQQEATGAVEEVVEGPEQGERAAARTTLKGHRRKEEAA